MRNRTLCFVMLAVAGQVISKPAAADEDFSVVINPRTGATFLRNDTNTAANIDGYLFVSDSDVFTGNWISLTDNATPGWSEGQATTKILSEVNLSSSLSLPGHGTVPLGSPYNMLTPTAFGEPEPEFKFTISVDGVGVFAGDLEFEMDNNLVLVVDPISGEAVLENQSQFDVNINSYLIQSGVGALDTGGWTRLQTSLGGGWTASTGTPTRIAEVNAFGSAFVAANGGSLPLGSPIDPEQLDDEMDLIFQFSVAPAGGSGGASVLGGVLFAAAAGPPGDYNNDGNVDAADYVVWRKNKDSSNTLPNDNMIGGIIGQEHYNLWRSNFGNSSGASSASVNHLGATSPVPEPSSCISAVVLTMLLLACRGRPGKC